MYTGHNLNIINKIIWILLIFVYEILMSIINFIRFGVFEDMDILELKEEVKELKELNNKVNNKVEELKELNNKVNNKVEELKELNNKMNNKVEELGKEYKKLNTDIQALESLVTFQQNFLSEHEENKIEKINLIEKNNRLRGNYLLLLFSSKIKNTFAFRRILLFRKIINSLLVNIIEKNKINLRKTSPKFFDILKPEANQKPFHIIYCGVEKINEISKKTVDIVIDFIMFIHDYTSSKIHLNKIENAIEIIQDIKKNSVGNSSSSKGNHSENKTESSFHPNELINYVFDPYDIEKETKEMLKNVEEEEKINSGKKNKNNNEFIKKKEEDKKDKLNEEELKDGKAKSFEKKEEKINKKIEPCTNKEEEKIKKNNEKEILFENFKKKYIFKEKEEIIISEKEVELIKKIFFNTKKKILEFKN